MAATSPRISVSGIALVTVGWVSPLRPTCAGLLASMVTAWAAQQLPANQTRGLAAPVAGQAWFQADPSPTRTAAAGTGAGDAPHQAEAELADARHAGGVAMGAHVRLQSHPTIHRLLRGLADGAVQGFPIVDALGQHRFRGVGVMGPHQQGMAGEADLAQPGFETRIHGLSVAIWRLQQAVAEIGAPGQQLLLDSEVAVGVEEDHALEAHRQQRDGRMGAEAPFAGDRQAAAPVLQGEARLGHAGLAGVAAPFHRPAEAAQPIGVDRLQVQHCCSQAVPEGPCDHPLLAMAGGQGHLPAGIGRGMGRAAIGHGGA